MVSKPGAKSKSRKFASQCVSFLKGICQKACHEPTQGRPARDGVLYRRFELVTKRLTDKEAEEAIKACAYRMYSDPDGEFVLDSLSDEMKFVQGIKVRKSLDRHDESTEIVEAAIVVQNSIKDLIKDLPGWLKNLITISVELLKLIRGK